MTRSAASPDHAFDRVERGLLVVTGAVAIGGGLVLTAILVMVVGSITGRELGGLSWIRGIDALDWIGPVRGDFELVEVGCAIAVFSFLPYCQMVRGNVTVDFFVHNAPPRLKAALAALGNLAFTAVALLIAWQLTNALVEKSTASWVETSMILQMPVWWGYVPAVASLALLVAVCAFTVVRSVREALGPGEPSLS